MMSERICPKCQKRLGSNEHYFCSACGAALPPGLTLHVDIIQRSVYSPPPKNPEIVTYAKGAIEALKKARGMFTKEEITVGLAGLAVILITFTVFLYYQSVQRSMEVASPGEAAVRDDLSAQADSRIMDLELNFKSALFGADRITDFIPRDVDFYWESYDYGGVLDTVLEKDIPYKELLRASRSLLGDHFAVFSLELGGNREWGAVFIPRDLGLLTWALEEIKEDKVSFRLVGDKLVAATHDDIFVMVDNAQRGVELNLADKPQYVTTRVLLPNDGQMLVMFLSDEAKEAIEASVKNLSHDSLDAYIDKILKSGYDGLVVRKK
jgi:hypothetical protein